MTQTRIKKPKTGRTYHFSEEEEIELAQLDELVFEYQRTKSPLLAEAILKKFAPIINKYYGLLAFGSPSYDRDIECFIFLITRDRGLRIGIANRNYVSQKHNKQYIEKSIFYIYSMAKQAMEPEDLLAELNKLMLECANKYKWDINKKVHFTGFIANYYRYLVKQLFDRITKDVMHKYPLDFYNKLETTEAPSNVNKEIDWDWIMGKWGDDIFECLTPKEREIIKYKYYDKLNYTAISKKIFEHPNKVKKIIKEAINKLRSKLQR